MNASHRPGSARAVVGLVALVAALAFALGPAGVAWAQGFAAVGADRGGDRAASVTAVDTTLVVPVDRGAGDRLDVGRRSLPDRWTTAASVVAGAAALAASSWRRADRSSERHRVRRCVSAGAVLGRAPPLPSS